MEINDEVINHLADLSKLQFNAETKAEIKNDLSRILGFVDKLSELNTENIEPLIYLSEETNVLRADEVKGEVSLKEALLNAPKKDSDYFKVPKVIEQ